MSPPAAASATTGRPDERPTTQRQGDEDDGDAGGHEWRRGAEQRRLADEVLHNLRYQHDWTELAVVEVRQERREQQERKQQRKSHVVDDGSTSSASAPTSPAPIRPPSSPSRSSPLPSPHPLRLPRILLRGRPPRPLYIHPDLQIELLKAEHQDREQGQGQGQRGRAVRLSPEPEWVLPTHVTERLSLHAFADVFDAVDTLPPAWLSGRGQDGKEEGGVDGYGRTGDDALQERNGDDDDDDDDDDNAGEGDGDDRETPAGIEIGAQWRGAQRQKRILLATVHEDSTVVYYVMHDGIVKPRQN